MRHLASPSSSSSASSRFRRKSPIVLARYALIAGAISTILLLFWISSTTSGHDHSGDPSFLSRDRKDGNFQEDRKDREDHSSVLSFLSRDRKDGNFQEDGQDREDEEVERERDGGEGEIRTEQQSSCATVEEMGKGFASGSEKESLRVRELIKRHFEINDINNLTLASIFSWVVVVRSLRALQAALECVKRALDSYPEQATRPRIALVSDTPSLIKEITPKLTEFAEVIYFNYKSYAGNISGGSMKKEHQPVGFRAKDWGPARRWVAFVDFFLASCAKHAVISGAHRRVGTTYAQLLAALAAANRHGKDPMSSNFSFFSSFQSNILVNGLADQVGWGHAWNRFAGRLSCRLQPHQCAFTPLLPSGWWDGEWQSPIPRDIHRLQDYGVRMTQDGQLDEASLVSYCR